MQKDNYLIVGTPISHSLSPRLHNAVYRELGLARELSACDPREPAGFERLVQELRSGVYQGLCVTIPYKLQAAATCDTLSPTAEHTGAVNYIRREADGSLSGDNTDVQGFATAVQLELGFDLRDCCHVAVCGSGGASRAVVSALAQAGVKHIITVTRNTSRTVKEWKMPFPINMINYETLTQAEWHFDLLVNATSLGMSDDQMPVPADRLQGRVDAVYDVVYRKMGTTPLVAAAHELRIPAADGRSMLIEQAIVGMQFWGIEESSVRLRSIIDACLN